MVATDWERTWIPGRTVSLAVLCAVCDMKTRPAGIGNANADWMASLPSKLSAMPLKHLAVPGESVLRFVVTLQHDSSFFTEMFPSSSPRLPWFIHILGGCQCSCGSRSEDLCQVLGHDVQHCGQKSHGKVVHDPGKLKVKVKVRTGASRISSPRTLVILLQNLSFREQLDAGIRYFDFRVSSKPGEPGNEIYFIHGLFGHKVSVIIILTSHNSVLSVHGRFYYEPFSVSVSLFFFVWT